MSKKIDLSNSKMWQSLDWDEKEVHPNLKRTDAQVNRTRANRLKGDNPEFRTAMHVAKTGKKRPDMLGDKNVAKTEAERKRRSLALTGVPKSQEQIKKFKESYKELSTIKCPHCGAESKNQGNMNRYHLDNCSSNPESPRYKKPTVVKTRKKQIKIKCPHCNKIGGANAMKRLHFDNCKHR
jgi:ssDNA-binding Zn-finger/Zn-ribbon topoisomerase 1